MIRPHVFDTSLPVDEQTEILSQASTIVSFVFTCSEPLSADDAISGALSYIRSFAIGMLPNGSFLSVVVDVEDERYVTTVDYRGPQPTLGEIN